nr:DUF2294 domain-containing protein [Salisediminibacterium selenitireducens]
MIVNGEERNLLKATRGQLELALSTKITQWEKDYLGRGSVSCKCDLIRDMAIVTLDGILTKAEMELSKDRSGREQTKKFRNDLVESGRHDLEQMVYEILQTSLVSIHTDISTKTGERVIVFKLSDPWDHAQKD